MVISGKIRRSLYATNPMNLDCHISRLRLNETLADICRTTGRVISRATRPIERKALVQSQRLRHHAS
jgi:hypothetical protein